MMPELASTIRRNTGMSMCSRALSHAASEGSLSWMRTSTLCLLLYMEQSKQQSNLTGTINILVVFDFLREEKNVKKKKISGLLDFRQMHSNVLAPLLCYTTRDLRQMPMSNKHILGVTSLWMGIPIFYGMLQAGDDVGLGALSCTLAAVCGVSVVFWLDPIEGSVIHQIKHALSWWFSAQLVWLSASNGLDPAGLVLLVTCIVFLYAMSDFFFQKALWRMHLLTHMLFRFAFYWWVHLLMVPPSRHEGTAFMTLTLSYFSQSLALYRGLLWKATLMRREQYWLSCAASLCWVWLNARAHWGLNKI